MASATFSLWVVGVSEEELGLLGPSEEELHVVLLGEADAAVDLVAEAATRRQASLTQAFAMDTSRSHSRPSLRRQAAWYVMNREPSTSVAMLAQWCWMAWKLPMGRPNCTLFLAYSTAISRTCWELPTISAHLPTEPLRRACSTMGPAFVDVAEGVGPRDPDVVQDDLALLVGGDGLENLVADARALGVDDEGRDAVVGVVGLLGASGDDEIVDTWASGTKSLTPLRMKSSPSATPVTDTRRVPAATGLGVGEGHDGLAVGDLGEVLLLLCVGAGVANAMAGDDYGVEVGARDQGPAELLDEDHEVQELEPGRRRTAPGRAGP